MCVLGKKIIKKKLKGLYFCRVKMKEMQLKKLSVLVFLLIGFFTVRAEKLDSIGTKVQNGKVYVMHRVEKGEGLYGIGRKYNVAIDQIIESNPGSDKMLKAGDILLIPTRRSGEAADNKTAS